jgi:hypothetical protein
LIVGSDFRTQPKLDTKVIISKIKQDKSIFPSNNSSESSSDSESVRNIPEFSEAEYEDYKYESV